MGGILTAFLSGQLCNADTVPGVDWYVGKADVVLLVQAQTDKEEAAFAPPEGQQRLRVVEVLKDVWTDPYVLVPANTVAPGGKAVLLLGDEAGLPWELALNPQPRKTKITCWPVEKEKVDTGSIPAKSRGKGDREPAEVTLQTIRAEIAASSPDDAGLSVQVVEACLFPEKLGALERKDPRRAQFVRMMAVLRDLDRDVLALSALLESPDKSVHSATEVKLKSLTDTDPLRGRPADKPQQAAEAWRRWWETNRSELSWDEKAAMWTKQADALPWPRRWPALPTPLKHPADAFPADLLRALEKNDAAAFAPAFRRWLDSGVLRDRQLVAAAKPYQITSAIIPALRSDLVLNEKLAPAERMKALGLASLRWHHDRFAAERRQAIELLQAGKPDAGVIGRAAFWELRESNVRSPGTIAVELLTRQDDAKSQEVLAALFFARPDDALLHAARAALAAGRPTFEAALLRYAKDHRDNAAGWACWAFCLESKPDIIPIMMDWLKDPRAETRTRTGHNLSFFPREESIPGLLAAIKKETDAKAKASLLTALAQTDDKRGLDVLLAAATPDQDRELQIQLARGLARIRDKRALPALATLAERSKDQQLSAEVVNAFGWISGLFKAFPPQKYFSGSGIEPDRIKEGMEAIARWRKQQ
jgi:hypothetical protein